MNGRTYGNSNNGYGYSPRNYEVNRFSGNGYGYTNANGNRTIGYYGCTSERTTGEWVQSGSGMWFKR